MRTFDDVNRDIRKIKEELKKDNDIMTELELKADLYALNEEKEMIFKTLYQR